MQPISTTRRLREIAGATALLLFGCDGIATVEVERTSMAVFFEDQTPSDIDFGEFENDEGISSEDIAGAHVRSVVVEVVAPEGGDLEFADRVEIYVDAPGLERQLIAFQDRFPEGESRISLEVMGVDLERYVLADTIGFTAEVDGEAPDDDTIISATARLDVDVTAAGVCNAM